MVERGDLQVRRHVGDRVRDHRHRQQGQVRQIGQHRLVDGELLGGQGRGRAHPHAHVRRMVGRLDEPAPAGVAGEAHVEGVPLVPQRRGPVAPPADVEEARAVVRGRHLRGDRVGVVEPRLHLVEGVGAGEDRAPVLERGDAAHGEGAPVAQRLDGVLDVAVGLAGADEVGVEGVRDPPGGHGAVGGHEGLGEHLPAVGALHHRARMTPDEDAVGLGAQAQQINEFSCCSRHVTTLPRRTPRRGDHRVRPAGRGAGRTRWRRIIPVGPQCRRAYRSSSSPSPASPVRVRADEWKTVSENTVPENPVTGEGPSPGPPCLSLIHI